MENHAFFIERWEDELPRFAKVIAAMPDGQLGYKPHERSTGAGALAWQIVEEQRALSDLLDTGEIHWETRPAPASVDEISKAWEENSAALRPRLAALDAAKCAGPADFLVGGHSAWKDTISNMLWGFLFDMVHHRGQLSSYLRPMGGKVPAIYGPSADDAGE